MILFLQWLVVAAILVSGAGPTTDRHTGKVVQSARLRQLMDGEELFRSYCAACHGADGKGRGPAAFALKTPPADLTVIAKRSGGRFPHARIARYVENGDPSIPAHGSKEMPVWGPNFAALAPGSNKPINERVDAVVAYIESIQITK